MVLLSGEPGVGKSRLAIDLVEYARQTGAIVLRGGCYEFEATTPYLPFVEAFREWARLANARALADAPLAHTPEIGKFAPEIETRVAAPAPRVTLSPGEERLRLFDHAARFLQSLAAGSGLLVFIDDIHWADQGTLSLCTICCAIFATTACFSSPPTARSSSIARIHWPRRWSTGTANGWRSACSLGVCLTPRQVRSSLRCSAWIASPTNSWTPCTGKRKAIRSSSRR